MSCDRKGRTEPRIYTPPKRELTERTSYGFAFIEFCDAYGFELLPWQKWLAIHALELNEDGMLRFRIVVTIMARQNGKTIFSELLVLFFLYVLEVQMVLGTSLSLDQAEEVWERVVDAVENDEELSSELERVRRANGAKSLCLTGGRQYKVSATAGTASRKGGRGKSVDLLLLDEIREHQTWDAWGATTKTTLARPNALTWCISNAGDEFSVVLRSLRMTCHQMLGDPDGICKDADLVPTPDDGLDNDSVALFEWSALPSADIWDRDAWAMANPSLGYGFLTERALSTAAATDTERVFRIECLCQWPERTISSPFPAGSWEAGVDKDSKIADMDDITFGVDMSADRTAGTIAVCGKRSDGLYHVEVIAHRTGADWMVRRLADIATRRRVRVAMQGRGAPISAYIGDFEELQGVEVVKCEGRDVGAWTGRFYDSVAACLDESTSDAVEVMHVPQPLLDDAASVAQRKDMGDGAFAFDRRKSPLDVSPLIACVMAYGLASVGHSTQRQAYTSAYSDERRLVTI